MKIQVAESGRTVAEHATVARNPWQRFRGLMLRSRLQPGEGLVITPCSSIHMMFMRFAIDAVFYDKSGRVTNVASGVRPWIGMAWGKGGKSVVELPVGAAAGLKAGDQLLMTD
jgi:uncharacterized protein